MGVTPIYIEFAIAFNCATDPADMLGDSYDSLVGREVKHWLLDQGLIASDPWGKPTEKLRVWIDHLCAQPLPEIRWTVPAPPSHRERDR